MKKLEIFFDYHCPYCFKGHEQLRDFLRQNPEVAVEWRPCEIFRLPGNTVSPKHIDLCLQGMFFVVEIAGDLESYHDKVYDLLFNKNVKVDGVDAFVGEFEGFFSEAELSAFRQALKDNKYRKNLDEANNFAFRENVVHVVPTYRADDGFLQDRQEFFNMGATSTGYGGAG